MSASSSSRLLTMPLEILQHISHQLTTLDYGCLRLTCKHVEASLYPAFAREFFSKRQFMLTEFSLQALVDISKSRLSPGLKHVVINVERPMPPTSAPGHGQQIPDPRNSRHAREYIEHVALVDTGHDVEMLAEAFGNLANLETVEVRDFNSQSRHRDFQHTGEWRSYGAPTYMHATGSALENRLPNWPQQGNLHVNHTFMGVLRALGRTKSRPPRFEVNLRNSGLSDAAFNVPKYVEPGVLPVLGTFQDLYLDVKVDRYTDFMVQDRNYPGFYLRLFLSRLQQLERLRLNFQFSRTEDVNGIFSWLCEPPEVGSVDTLYGGLIEQMPPITFRKLEQLDIGKVFIHWDVLFSLLKKYRDTLRGIDFHRVNLTHAQDRPNEHLWARFFDRLTKVDFNFRHIRLSSIGQGRSFKQQINFKDTQSRTRTWEGHDWVGALKDFKDNLIEKPQYPVYADDTMNEDQSESDVSLESASGEDDDSDEEALSE
ncbi:hypothetical protein BX600DRAFT_172250 [Xylariales sp. PMI_506]|nr:hypothetical protein BX600DRAFT_172250 [Xylariales sp. PMI_506]